MGFSDLFKSGKQLARERQRAIQKAMNEAKSALNTCHVRLDTLRRERDAAWNDAREKLKNGQKAAAQLALKTVQAKDAEIRNVEHRDWVFNGYVTKLEMAQVDQIFSGALDKLNHTMHIDPAKIETTIAQTDDLLAEQSEVDDIWGAEYDNSLNSLAMNESIPSLDEMMQVLETEAAGSLGGSIAENNSSLAPEINASRKKLDELQNKKD